MSQPTAIEKLRKQQQEKEHQIQAAQDAQKQQALVRFKQQVRERLPADLLDELHAKFVYLHPEKRNGHPVCLLSYKDRTGKFAWGGYYSSPSFDRDAAAAILKWIQDIDRSIVEFEHERKKARARLLERLPTQNNVMDLKDNTDLVVKYELDQDPEIAKLLAEARDRFERRNAEWRRRQEEEEHRREQEREAQIQELIAFWDGLQTIDDSNAVYNLCEKYEYDVLHHGRVREAEERADARLAILAAQREENRLAAQEAAFHPWEYYRVEYGIAVSTHNSEEPHVIHINTFDTLDAEPNADGWYYDRHRRESIKPMHVIAVRLVFVDDPENQPSWSPTSQTEHGLIRVPPV